MSYPLKKILETRVLEAITISDLNAQLKTLQEKNIGANSHIWEPYGDIVIFQREGENGYRYVPTYTLIVNRYSIQVYGD